MPYTDYVAVIGAGPDDLAMQVQASITDGFQPYGPPVQTWGSFNLVQMMVKGENDGGGSEYTLPAASASALGGVKLATAQADSVATDAAGIVEDFNTLLAGLRASGVMASS